MAVRSFDIFTWTYHLWQYFAILYTGILNSALLFYCSEFCSVVRKIFIYTVEEVKKLSPKIGLLPINEEGKPSKLDSEAVVNPEDQSSIVGPGC